MSDGYDAMIKAGVAMLKKLEEKNYLAECIDMSANISEDGKLVSINDPSVQIRVVLYPRHLEELLQNK